ncbi:MAG: N-acetyltransferase family protein [Thiohalospira sp.]
MDPRRPITIRRASSADVPALADLLTELFTLEEDFEARPERQRAGVEALLADPRRAAVLVADAGGDPVGMATVQTVISTAEGGPVGRVEDVVVSTPWRRAGVGTALLEALEVEARHRGLARLQLVAQEDNTAARRFYTARGWRETSLGVLRRGLT